MKSQRIFQDRGFTLIELLVVMAVVAGLFSLGALIDLSTVNRENLYSAQSTLISVLQKARNRAMNNIGHTSHSVKVTSDEYVLDGEESIKRNSNISITKDGNNPFTVTFDQLTGNSSGLGVIKLADVNNNTKTVTIEEEGLINW